MAIEDMYQAIGSEALAIAANRTGKLIVYSEVEEGVTSADVFYDTADGVRYKFPTLELEDLVYSLWERWRAVPGNSEWRTMTYVIHLGKFDLDLAYPDQIDTQLDLLARRQAVLKTHFGDASVDYSNPE